MILTTTNRSFIEAEQYSDFILQNLHDGLLPTNFYRDVSDFGNGEVLNIKTIGEAQIQEIEEDQAITYSPIETGNIEMRITDYVGDGWYVTDKMRQDGAQIDNLLAVRGKEATRAIQEHFETRALATCNAGQVTNDPNKIDGYAHRFAGSGVSGTLSMDDLIYARLVFNKNEVPMTGRIGVVDSVVEATFNQVFQIKSGVGDLAANQVWQDITENGFAREHNFVINLFGWNIMTSNRLAEALDAATIKQSDGATDSGITAGDGVANLFMCIADDGVKPLMAAWRQQPRVEGERNKDKQRDEFVQTARYGFGLQRLDTLLVIVTSVTKYK